MTHPTFIGIGAQKCASTWIYDLLADHPDVALSPHKEIDFFSYHYGHGLQWYENNFNGAGDCIAVGEISPSYFHEPGVPQRAHRHYPDVKLIVSLRNPIKRAISNHVHEIRIGHLTGDDLSLEKGLQNNPMYVEQGRYAKHLERWLACFPKEQILILLFEDIVSNRADTAKRLYRFLGIDENHLPCALDSRSNPSYVNRYSGLEVFRRGLRKVVRRIGLDLAWDFAAKIGVRQLYKRVNKVSGEAIIPEPQDATLQQLMAEFNDDISRLESILSRDLSMWR
ncbi:MAG: sulfotransferase domain-containing protein [Candidatus Thiodiazotropha sp. (ex Ustalcina ferruginea)]|nr:sulfotransferase domain-containing protein [Candidatus Thiodiazotropha sp. (ex Ustalcina ferruginea)]